MPSSLSYSTGFNHGYTPPLSRRDLVDPIDKDVFAPFNDTLESIEANRKKAEEEKAKRLAEHKKLREEVDTASTVNLWDGDYSLYNEVGQWLMSDEVINEFASTPEGMAQWEQMVQQYSDQIGLSEEYYKSTYGSNEEAENPTLSTWNSGYFRSLLPDQNFYETISMRDTVTWDQMEAKAAQLNEAYHVPGSIRFENGQIVYTTLDGKTEVLGQHAKDMKVFDPGLVNLDVSGYDYFTKVDDGNFETEEAVNTHIKNATRDVNSVNFKRMMEHYLNSDAFQGPKLTIDEVLASEQHISDYLPSALKLWQEEALTGWRKPKSTTPKTTETQTDRDRRLRREAGLNGIRAIGDGATYVGELFRSVVGEEGPSTVPGSTLDMPLPLSTNIQVIGDDGEALDMKVSAIRYQAGGEGQDVIYLTGTTTKVSGPGQAQTIVEQQVKVTADQADILASLSAAIDFDYRMTLEQILLKFAAGEYKTTPEGTPRTRGPQPGTEGSSTNTGGKAR